MLQSLRKTSNSLFVKLLFVMLIASFAIWGIGDVLRASPGSGPITVGDRQINMQEIDREFRILVDRQSRALGFPINPAQGLQIGLLDQAISNLVGKALIDNLAASAGLRIEDEAIRAFIRDELGFRTPEGQFNRLAFEQDLQQRNITEQLFIDQLRLDLARNRVLEALAAGVRVPDQIARTLYAFREETRVVDFVRVAADAMDDPEPPADDVLQAFYDARTDSYMAPEYRSASVVVLDPEALTASVTVDEEQLNEEYLYRQESLLIPEQRTIEQMILADGEQAEAAAAALREGRSFASVAEEIAGQEPESLAMGVFSQAEWFVPDAADALFGGEAGAVSGAVETPLGWRIYRVSAIEPEHQPTLDEVRDDLHHEIALRIANDMLFDMSAQFQDELAGGAKLAEAAASLGLAAERFGPVSADGMDPDAEVVTVPGGEAVLSAAFEGESATEPTQHNLPNGGMFFVEVGDIIAPARQPFDEVRDEVLADWTDEQKFEAARALAGAVADDLAVGMPLAEVAEARGLEVLTAAGVRRDGTETGGLPIELAADLFDMSASETGQAEASAERAVYVAVLREIVAAPDDAAALKAVWLQLSVQATGDVFVALNGMLQDRYRPTTQDELIRQTFASSYGS